MRGRSSTAGRLLLLALALGLPSVAFAQAPPARLIRIQKAARQLHYEEAGLRIRSFAVGLGGAPEGDKERQGDSRTPEGEFFVSSKNPKSAFHRFIGLSYPMPRHAARGIELGLISQKVRREIERAIANKKIPPQLTPLGGYVGIHGGGGGADWTLGCIAVSNEEALWLFERIRLGDPIIVEP